MLSEVIESIIEELTDKLGVNYPVYESDVPDDVSIPANFKPFAVVHNSQPTRSSRNRGLCGSKNDAHILTVTVATYAPDTQGRNWLRDKVIDILTDFKPTGSGRMTLEGGGDWTEVASQAVPKRFVGAVTYRLLINL